MLRRPLILVAFASLALGLAGAQEEPTAPGAPTSVVRVRLRSLGLPRQVEIEGVAAASDLETGEPLPTEEGRVALAAEEGRLRAGDRRLLRVRLEGQALGLRAGGVARIYPGALIVTAEGRGLALVNESPLEAYVAGVLAEECPALFHPEAIRAIAVAVRSYTLRKARDPRVELCDTTHCHLYSGLGRVRPAHREAVVATAGLCALYAGEVIDAVYSADCGGYTEANEEAWPRSRPIPYLRHVEDAPEPGAEPYCSVNRSHRWNVTLPVARLRALLGKPASRVALVVEDTCEGGRVRRLRLESRPPQSCEGEGADPEGGARRAFTGEEWRRLLGSTVVRSLRFSVRETGDGVELTGTGWGHGAGLCQFGANGMARRGARFEEILKHYYTGVEIGPAPAFRN